MYVSSLPYDDRAAYTGIGYADDGSSLYTTNNMMYHTATDSGMHNIDPSLCALEHSVPSGSSVSSSPTASSDQVSMPATFSWTLGLGPFQQGSIGEAAATGSDDCIALQTTPVMAPGSPCSFDYGGLTSTTASNNPHSPCVDSDPYNESDVMPSTPEDQSLFVPASSSVGMYGGRSCLSPQPLSLRLTGQHLLSDGSTNFDDSKDINSFNATLNSVFDSQEANFVGNGDFGDCSYQIHLNNNSCLPIYNPLDRGFTLQSTSSHDETEIQQQPQQPQQQNYYSTLYSLQPHTTTTVYPIHRTQSPEPMQAECIQVSPVYYKQRELKPSPYITSASSGSAGVTTPAVKRRRGGADASTRQEHSIMTRSAAQSMSSARQNAIKQETTPTPASPLTPAVMATSPATVRKTLVPSAACETEYRCDTCALVLSSSFELQAHCKKEHEKPFVCIFHWAGCTSAFGNKNEWKRHVMAQHLMLTYWRCDDEKCDRMRRNCSGHPYGYGPGSSSTSVPTYPHAEQTSSGIFNRKDLFTQHVRRMHMPEELKVLEREYSEEKKRLEGPAGGKKGNGKNGKGSKGKKRKRSGEMDAPASASLEMPAALCDWNENLKELQRRSEVSRCELPEDMACPQCKKVFHGSMAWNERMEHVAEHMQQAHDRNQPSWPFEGTTDPTLTQWAERFDVQIVKRRHSGGGSVGVHLSWELNNPLQQLVAGEMGDLVKNEVDGEGEMEFGAC